MVGLEASGRYSEVSWGGCPWIFLGGSGDDCVTPQVVAGLDGIPKASIGTCVQGCCGSARNGCSIGPGVTSLMIQTVPFVRGQSR